MHTQRLHYPMHKQHTHTHTPLTIGDDEPLPGSGTGSAACHVVVCVVAKRNNCVRERSRKYTLTHSSFIIIASFSSSSSLFRPNTVAHVCLFCARTLIESLLTDNEELVCALPTHIPSFIPEKLTLHSTCLHPQ